MIDTLKEEAAAFDTQIMERVQAGFLPDLRRLKKVKWFYNNVWRDPFFVQVYLMPKVNYVIDIAKKKNGNVLEIGCGSGYLSLELARNGLNVTGIDLSEESISVAKHTAMENTYKKGFGRLQYKCGDIREITLNYGFFDSIVFFSSFHHMTRSRSLLQRVCKLLKPNGNLILVEPVRGEFTKRSAEVAGILRFVLPTYVSFDEKKDILNTTTWESYCKDVLQDYTFKGDHIQSPHDNITDTAKEILDAVNTCFDIKQVHYSGAFIEKIIGSLRGRNKYVLSELLIALDEKLVREQILPPTHIQLWAQKKELQL